MNWLSGLAVLAATLVAMEGVATLSHRYVMHGFLWSWHRSHHEPRQGHFERNDRFALLFAAISVGLIYVGRGNQNALFWMGWGMAAYGLIYFLFHDGLVHGRIPMPGWAKNLPVMRHLVQAHYMHHATHTKHGNISYGFLYAPPLDILRARFNAAAAKTRAAPVPADIGPEPGHKAR
jgi:beta-carotene 3-hydroxylase